MPLPIRIQRDENEPGAEEIIAALLDGELIDSERHRLMQDLARHPDALEILAYAARVGWVSSERPHRLHPGTSQLES